MNIWITSCRKTVQCANCQQDIELGSPMVVGSTYKDYGEGHKWSKKLYWHVSRKEDGVCCWVEQGLHQLALRPFVETRGRKKQVLDEAQSAVRLKLLQKHARLKQVIKEEMQLPADMLDTSRLERLGRNLEQLRTDILLCGGVPKKW